MAGSQLIIRSQGISLAMKKLPQQCVNVIGGRRFAIKNRALCSTRSRKSSFVSIAAGAICLNSKSLVQQSRLPVNNIIQQNRLFASAWNSSNQSQTLAKADDQKGVSVDPTIHRKDYSPPMYFIPEVKLAVVLPPNGSNAKTIVKSDMQMKANNSTCWPLILDGDADMVLKRIVLNGKELTRDVDYTCYQDKKSKEQKLEIFSKCMEEVAEAHLSWGGGSTFQLQTEVEIQPEQNKSCMGLYTTKTTNAKGQGSEETGESSQTQSSPPQQQTMYTTQMEAEGFRKFTYFLDRPDIMSKYTCEILAPKADYPVLLSNGNRTEYQESIQGQELGQEVEYHKAVYVDPFAKPGYLFALVAGNLHYIEDTFVTNSNSKAKQNNNMNNNQSERQSSRQREVTLRVYAEPWQTKEKLQHSMRSLKKAMKFDEEYFGLEYDLDIFNVVSVRDFNMGAMENKSLNIFNESLILWSPDTWTDQNYEAVESVVAHEYFHNWTGNRVTCRDWFQLTLKEGLTVFRDQTFSNLVGLNGRASRIDQVERLRNHQFPEDNGPLAHPIRPESFEKIDNFYTATVYEKGAEFIRMYQTILGEEGFKRGLKLYLTEYDGTAATCDQFLKAMEEANGVDLSQFGKWLETKGTPTVSFVSEVSGDKKEVILNLKQSIKQQQGKKDESNHNDVDDDAILHIPIAFGVIDRKTGKEIVPTAVHHLKTKTDQIVIDLPWSQQQWQDYDPVLSLNRGFSAPIIVDYDQMSLEDRATLATHDTDMFGRWEWFQQMVQQVVYGKYNQQVSDSISNLDQELSLVLESVKMIVNQTCHQWDPNGESDINLGLAQTLSLPTDTTLINNYGQLVDPVKMSKARSYVKQQIGLQLKSELETAYQKLEKYKGELEIQLGKAQEQESEYIKDADIGQQNKKEGQDLQDLALGALAGAAVVAGAVAAAPAAAGIGLGISAAGPTAGGIFAASQAATGAVAAGSTAAALQSIAMGGVATGTIAKGAAIGAAAGACGASSSKKKNNDFINIDKVNQQLIGLRRLQNTLQAFLSDEKLSLNQFKKASEDENNQNMTMQVGAFQTLVGLNADKETGINEKFYDFAKQHPLVMNKWFMIQAMNVKSESDLGGFDRIKELYEHPEFTVSNPNRIRSLANGLIANTQLFHSPEGIQFMGALIKEVDGFGNGQIASRLATSFQCHSKLLPEYADRIQEQVRKLLEVDVSIEGEKGLGPETKEILEKIVVK